MESEKEQVYYADKNIVLVGIKPFMNYVTALKMQFDKNDEVFICARGKFISKMFDIVEVCKRNFMVNWKVTYEKIKVDSQVFTNEDGREIYVSSVEVRLIKEKA